MIFLKDFKRISVLFPAIEIWYVLSPSMGILWKSEAYWNIHIYMSYVWENILNICMQSRGEYLQCKHPVSVFSLILSQLMEIDIDKCKLIIAFPFGLFAVVNNKHRRCAFCIPEKKLNYKQYLELLAKPIVPQSVTRAEQVISVRKRFVYHCLWYIFPLFLWML